LITRLTGVLLPLDDPTTIHIECQGVQYALRISITYFFSLNGKTGQVISLPTLQKEDKGELVLYGFVSDNERFAFRQLTAIEGVGPRTAMAVLSRISAEDLADIALRFDVGAFTKAAIVIGPKTAERILSELKGSLQRQQDSVSQPVHSPRTDLDVLLDALAGMGYARARAASVIQDLPTDLDSNAVLRLALEKLITEGGE
jgi:Holliday junction DNA helicase RuvA